MRVFGHLVVFLHKYLNSRNLRLMLNYVWAGLILIGFIVAVCRAVFLGDVLVFERIINGTFDMSIFAVMDVALPLAGVMTLWLGLMNIGEKAGAIRFLSRIVGPFFSKLFPEIVSSVDMESVYTSNEYEFYKLCSLKPGCEYPKMTLAFSGFEFMDVKVKVVDFTDQGWVLEYYAPHLKSGWPCIIIGTGGAKKYLCNSESNPQKWTSWYDITIETGNGYSFNFIKDRMDESAIVPYNWKLNL